MRDLHMLWRRRSLYRQVFSTPEGQAVLRDLLDFCGVAREVVVPGDPLLTGFNDGKRRVGLRIGSLINLSDAEALRLSAPPQGYDNDTGY